MEEILKKYSEAARNQKDSESYLIANKWHTQLIKIYKALKKEKKIYLLKSLLNDPHVGVRSWAATHYLSIDEVEAKKTLVKIAEQGGKFGLGAEMVTKEWDNGNLKTYYENM